MDSSNNEIGEIMSLFNTHGFVVIKGDKGYGLIDKQLKVILDCSYIFKYNRCGPDFAYHYLVVQKNGCYGLVNEIGKIVVPCQYPGFASFSNADNNNLLDRGFFMWKIGNCQKHSESVKNQRILKIKALCLVSHSKLWLVIRL